MVRIRRLGVIRTANVLGIVYVLITLMFVVPFALILVASGPMQVTDRFGRTVDIGFAPLLLLLAPILYGIIGWIFTALFAILYNLASWVAGGVEMQLDTVEPSVQAGPAWGAPPPPG